MVYNSYWFGAARAMKTFAASCPGIRVTDKPHSKTMYNFFNGSTWYDTA